MNAHQINTVARFVQRIAEPEFTAKLSFAEQDALAAADPDKYWRYVDWLFAGNAAMSKRWERRERQEQTNMDIDRTHDRLASGADDYTSNPKQAST